MPRLAPWEQLGPWLRPGLGVKRWVALYAIGLTLLALGLGLVLAHVYRTGPLPAPTYYLTLQFVPRLPRGLLVLGFGVLLMGVATLRLVQLFGALLVPHYRGRVGDALYAQRCLSRGPKIVAIGGGTGLSSLLRGLKAHTSNLTAVLTVCDDGGSSGRLRRDLRVLPPGDFRQCLAALADADPLVTRLFEHRFQTAGSALAGHAFGNLLIVALAQLTGSFEGALEASSRVLAVAGRILPSTLEDVTLCAELADHSTVAGESRIPELVAGRRPTAEGDGDRPGAAGQGAAGGQPAAAAAGPGGGASGCNPIRRVFLQPERPPVYTEVTRELQAADLIVIGPGSLYTSVLPNLLVEGLAGALCRSPAAKVYVCNVATQPGETDRYDVQDHVRAIQAHVASSLGADPAAWAADPPDRGATRLLPFTHVLVNNNLAPHIPAAWGVTRPQAHRQALADLGVQVIEADLVDEARPTRHDPGKLARAVLQVTARSRLKGDEEPRRPPAARGEGRA